MYILQFVSQKICLSGKKKQDKKQDNDLYVQWLPLHKIFLKFLYAHFKTSTEVHYSSTGKGVFLRPTQVFT